MNARRCLANTTTEYREARAKRYRDRIDPMQNCVDGTENYGCNGTVCCYPALFRDL
jgi:hypothetical protein